MKLRVPFKMLCNPTPPFRVTGKNAALLVMDAQRFTTLRDEGLGELALARGIQREFVEYYDQVDAGLRNLQKLLAACRQHGVAVIYTVLNAQKADRSDLSRQLRQSGLPIPVNPPDYDIRPEVAPAPGERVLHRGTYSPFVGTDLLDILREAQIDTLILSGMMAEVGLALTAEEAADRDLGVILAWDASASQTLDWHDNMRTRLVSPLIRLRSAQQVIEMMKGSRT